MAKATKQLDWSAVIDSSSSIDAVVSLAEGGSFSESVRMLCDPRVQELFRSLARLKVSVARNRARAWCRREKYDFS